ncbi:hypothetical protein ACVBEF_04535 [Glaciimonas sp. GG7]
MTRKLPSTLDEWERLLVNYFLMIAPDGDASDIHSFEVTRSTLAIACGVDMAFEEEVEVAFRKVLVNDPLLIESLKCGSQRISTNEVPRFFTHLILTLFIDSLLDGKHLSKGAFRGKLSDWLGKGKFANLKGVASTWKELVTWLDQRVAAGDAFRHLVLPDPRGWNQIGYTRRLSFPNRSDIRLVERVVQERCVSLDYPAVALNAFLLVKDEASTGLRDAIEDFRLSYYAQRRALAEHRFWRLLTRVRVGMYKGTSYQTNLELIFNEDAEREFCTSFQEETEIHGFSSLAEALISSGAASSANLGPAINRGILFFRQTGLGRWQVEPDLARCHDRVYVALATKHEGTIGQRLGQLIKVGWLITAEPKSIKVVDSTLTQAYFLAGAGERIFRPAVTNGVRVQGLWLGLPRFLPSIDADTSELVVSANTVEAPAAKIVSTNGVVQLVSDVPLVGIYTVKPELHNGERSAPWQLRMQFVDRALPHAVLNGARYKLEPMHDWNCVESRLVWCDGREALDWEPGSTAMENLLEAVYADGGSGWDEKDLVDLVRRAADKLDPWLMLRLLQDAGVIAPRLRQGWKGRVWTLVAPRIVKVCYGNAEMALVEGALCSQLRDDFKLAVQGLGGHCFNRQDVEQWSVPVMGAAGVSPVALAERLGWPLAMEVDTAGSVPFALADTKRHAEHYQIASTWCWSARRFVRTGAIDGPVRLSLRSHQNNTDHDVYRVEQGGRSFHYLSRCAAIIAAHGMAAVPMFEFRGDHIARLSQEGSLPDLLSAMLRRCRLRAAGMNGRHYVYPASEADVRWLVSLLPGCIVGPAISEQCSAGSVLSTARRSGGRLRPQWLDNQLVLQLNNERTE